MKKTIIKYVDPHQNVYWFEEEPCRNSNFCYGTIIKIRKGLAPNIHDWQVGDKMSAANCVCVVEENFKEPMWTEEDIAKFKIAADILAQNKDEIERRSKQGIKFSQDGL